MEDRVGGITESIVAIGTYMKLTRTRIVNVATTTLRTSNGGSPSESVEDLFGVEIDVFECDILLHIIKLKKFFDISK